VGQSPQINARPAKAKEQSHIGAIVKTADIIEQFELLARVMEITIRHRSTMRKIPIVYMFPAEIVAANRYYKGLRSFRPNRRTPVTLKNRRAEAVSLHFICL
jgi:hypothetical protein